MIGYSMPTQAVRKVKLPIYKRGCNVRMKLIPDSGQVNLRAIQCIRLLSLSDLKMVRCTQSYLHMRRGCFPFRSCDLHVAMEQLYRCAKIHSQSEGDHNHRNMSACSEKMTVPTNVQSLLHSVTPNVPSKYIPQRCINDLTGPVGKDTIEYFTLGDLWECYKEWSAFGAGIPLVLNNGEDIVQYYVPYLSAIQIYTNTNTNKSSATHRNPREDSDLAECEGESWSDDSEGDKLSGSLSNHSCKIWDTTSPDSSFDRDGSWPTRDHLGSLYLQYYETCSPYWRIPLTDKITELARNCLGLLTLKSVDLSPASWMGIAWYPIYHIPTKGNVKDLSTCFLTYHTLSSSFQDSALENYEDIGKDIPCSEVVEEILGCKYKGKESSGVSLPPFGLATYKMQGNLWMKPDTCDDERLMYLHSAADSWLKQLSVQHHDFNYFTSHSTTDIGMSS